MSGTERLPFAEYFGDAGLDVQVEAELPDLGYVLKEMLGIQSVSQTPVGDLIIHRSSAYQDGDNLMAINGMPVNAFEDIAKLAKDWHSGDVVELTIGRVDAEITMSVTLGGTSEKPPLDAGLVDVTVTKRADSTAAQRAILAGILGGLR